MTGTTGGEPGPPDEPDIAGLAEEIDRVERDAERRAARSVDFGGRALVISVAVFVLIVGLILPWMSGATGYEVLLGTGSGDAVGKASMVPRLFAATSVAFGVLASALALMTRRWVLTWVCALGGWFTSVDGVLAIWSRQSSQGDIGVGMVIAWVAMLVIATQWFRTAWSRPDPTAP
ncbi:Rv2732c family membrane protein [Actinophytocola sp.]|uniref:Rv2732c family membrane protein n=1 Tax=Actinophytocola sp. TaxID=1872138 RepID=UPI003D6ABB0A